MNKSEKINKTKKKILECAEKLFAEKSYDAVSIDDITKSAGIAKGLFFYYFEKKQDILFTLMKLKRDEAITKFKEKAKAENSEITKESVCNQCISFVTENRDIFRIALFEFLKTNTGANIILEMPKSVFTELKDVIELTKEEQIKLVILVIKTTIKTAVSENLCDVFEVSKEKLEDICKEMNI